MKYVPACMCVVIHVAYVYMNMTSCSHRHAVFVRITELNTHLHAQYIQMSCAKLPSILHVVNTLAHPLSVVSLPSEIMPFKTALQGEYMQPSSEQLSDTSRSRDHW